MNLERIADKVIETDVLVIGGGPTGCCAAARAADNGLNVTLAEKSKPERSGSAAMGIDHYSLLPNGVSPLVLVRSYERWLESMCGEGRFVNPNILYKIFTPAEDGTIWQVEDLRKLGITVDWYDGKLRWSAGKTFGAPGARTTLRVPWQNLKPEMARSVRKRGVNVLERTMAVDLLTNQGVVVGATAVNTRTGEFIVVKSKATVIATGLLARIYEPESPQIWKYKYRYHWCPATVSGDGMAAAYRAGADLGNMDIASGGHYLHRDSQTISYGNFPGNEGVPGKYVDWKGEEIPFATALRYRNLIERGLDPMYLTIENLNEDYQKRVEVMFVDERMISFKHAEKRGFNPKNHRYELTSFKPVDFIATGGIHVDEDFRSNLKGLFAVGDAIAGIHGLGRGIPSALLTGDILPDYVKATTPPVVDKAQVESQKEKILAPLAVKDGTEPSELECSIRYICERYVGSIISEGKLREGQNRLASLRREFLPQLMAKNPHYLLRCLEVRNLMDLAKVHIQACLSRKETRGNYLRADYPELDPARTNMSAYQRIENGKPVLEIREVPDLRPEYAKEE